MRKLLFLSFAIFLCPAARALTPAELTPAEKTAYSKLSGDDAKHYLATRGYFKACKKVLANPASAVSLPDLPDDYDGRFVTPAEQKQVDDAMDLSFAALANSTRKTV